MCRVTCLALFGFFAILVPNYCAANFNEERNSHIEGDHSRNEGDNCSPRVVAQAMKCCNIPEIVTDLSCLTSLKNASNLPESTTSISIVRKKREDESETTTKPKRKKKKLNRMKTKSSKTKDSKCIDCAIEKTGLLTSDGELNIEDYNTRFVDAGGDSISLNTAIEACKNDVPSVSSDSHCSGKANRTLTCIRKKLVMSCLGENRVRPGCTQKMAALRNCSPPLSSSSNLDSGDHTFAGPSRLQFRKKKLVSKRRKIAEQ